MNIAVKKGMLLRHQNAFYFVEDIKEHHSGKQRPTYHVALRDAFDGRHIERTIDQLEPIQEVPANYRMLQFLYSSNHGGCVFMDTQSFEEIELREPQLQGCEPFLREGEEFKVLFADNKPLRLDLPENVTLKVADTAAPTHAVGTAGSVMKEALLDNGLQIRVPLFIRSGDLVKINTHTREYQSKVHE
jgi:elongation factor P